MLSAHFKEKESLINFLFTIAQLVWNRAWDLLTKIDKFTKRHPDCPSQPLPREALDHTCLVTASFN